MRRISLLSVNVWIYLIFQHYLINSTILGKTLLNTKCGFSLLYKFCLKRSKNSATYTDVRRSSCHILTKLQFLDRFFKYTEITNFTKIFFYS